MVTSWEQIVSTGELHTTATFTLWSIFIESIKTFTGFFRLEIEVVELLWFGRSVWVFYTPLQMSLKLFKER